MLYTTLYRKQERLLHKLWVFVLSLALFHSVLPAPASLAWAQAAAVPTAAPDLVIESLTFDPANPGAGSTVTVMVVVKNQGDAPTAGFNTYLYVEPSDDPPTTATTATSATFSGLTLEPGATFTWRETGVSFTQNNPKVYAWVDPVWENHVTEADENNNLFPAPTQNGAPDAYEDDDTCQDAKPIAADGVEQQRNLAYTLDADLDWVKFAVSDTLKHRLTATASGADADLRLELYDGCEVASLSQPLRSVELEFTATANTTYYLLVKHKQAEYGSNTDYRLKLIQLPADDPSTLALAEVPLAVHRRAQDFLEEMRGSPLAPEWNDKAHLSSEVHILYRPDIQGPAYYEFLVETLSGGAYVPAGFIQLSAGNHDYPVSHWNATGLSPTMGLAELGQGDKGPVTTYYKLDVLSYAAEYEQLAPLGISIPATDVVTLGTLPVKLTGLDALSLDPSPELASVEIASDGTTEISGPQEAPLIQQEEWNSWDDLKAGYTASYGVLLESLSSSAALDWEEVDGVAQYGEAIVKGDTRTIYALTTLTVETISLIGAGADSQYVQHTQLVEGDRVTGVEFTVAAEPVAVDLRLPLEVSIRYTGGITESMKYVLVNALALRQNEIFLPLIANSPGSDRVTSAGADGTTAIHGQWGEWNYWWAGTDADQRLFDQIPKHSPPNTSRCPSGCGATAWAMLFGWIDYQATQNHPIWRNQWGIYRQDGGYGADAVAPPSMDAGVANMTWEIRNHIGTACIFGKAPTYPSGMDDASKYLRDRATDGWRLQTKYDPTALCWFGICNRNRDLARDSIIDRGTPAIIGTGWFSHYPLAYGYRERSRRTWACAICPWKKTEHQREFYVNQGWSGYKNSWVGANTWFAGILKPY